MTPRKERSFIVTDSGLRSLLRYRMTKVETTVLWHLVASLPPGGDTVSKAVLAEQLSITRVQATLTVKRLCELGFLMRGPRLGLSYHYKVNPALFRFLS